MTMVGRMRLLLGLVVVVAAAVVVGSAAADPFNVPVCPGESAVSPGQSLSGTVNGNLTITGNAYVAKGNNLTVKGNLTLAPGSCLDAFSLGTVNVGGNVLVQQRAILALGCSVGAIGPGEPCESMTTNDTVGGNIVATNATTMYLTALWVGGNIVSNGGGPGLSDPYTSFPIKESTIRGNLVVNGWVGAWFGALRNTVYGNVIITNNVGNRVGDFGPDSNEVVQNTVHGNLICTGNVNPVTFGDSGGAPNSVYGNAIGQCGFNVVLPNPNYPNQDGKGLPTPISVKAK